MAASARADRTPGSRARAGLHLVAHALGKGDFDENDGLVGQGRMEKGEAAAVGREPAAQVCQPWISCTAAYCISFSSTSAGVRQSMRCRVRKRG